MGNIDRDIWIFRLKDCDRAGAGKNLEPSYHHPP